MAVAPEVAEAASFGVADFAVLFALLGLIALRFIWDGTIGALLARIASALRAIPNIPFTHVGGSTFATPFENADNYIHRKLGEGIAATEYAFHKFLSWQAYILVKTGEIMAALAVETYHALLRAKHYALHTQPQVITQRITKTVVQPIIRTVIPKPAAVRQTVDHFPALAARVAKLEAAQAAAAAQAIAIPVPHTGDFERVKEWVRGEVGKLKWAGVFAGVGALGLAILSKLGLGFLRCPNWKRFGKQACGLNPSLLESLLADALLIVSTISIVEFAKELQAVEGEVVTAMRGFVRELR